MDRTLFQIRVTGILIRDDRLLLVRQRVSDARSWSLPGGRAEAGETLEEATMRELFEETGLRTRVTHLLYLCDKPDAAPPVLHITFALEQVGGTITLPTNAFDDNPITDVRFVPVAELADYGFTPRFVGLIREGFPNRGAYMGLKANIGL